MDSLLKKCERKKNSRLAPGSRGSPRAARRCVWSRGVDGISSFLPRLTAKCLALVFPFSGNKSNIKSYFVIVDYISFKSSLTSHKTL